MNKVVQFPAIPEGAKLLPHVSPSATPRECEALANEVFLELSKAITHARAAVDKLNECLPVLKVNTSFLDDTFAGLNDFVDDIEARATMIREQREWDW